MPHPQPRPRPLLELLHLLWQVPVVALPFAAFFQLTSREPFSAFLQFYAVALAFSGSSLLGVWLVRNAIQPRILAGAKDDRSATLLLTGTYTAVCIGLGFVTAVILNFTLLPGFLGSAREVLTLVVYFLLFGALFLGISLAFSFYKAAMERAGSERELLLARRIQESFLLSEFPRRPRLEVHATNLSSKEVSGDFYDVVPVGDDGYLLAVADVSGKGVPAALLSSMLQASLRTQALAGTPVSAMMRNINGLVCGRAVTGQFATFFLARVSERDMTLRFTNAGHNFPVLFRRGGERKTLETGGLVVGMLDDVPYEEESVALRPGDRVVLYTDGVTEAARADREMFGEERLIALVESLPADLGARDVVARILEGLRAFLGETEAGDDVTVMALRVLEEGSGS